MKKKILLALVSLVLLFSIVLAGCGGGVPQGEYDQIVAQLADTESKLTKAQNDLSALQSQKTAVDADLVTAQAQVADLQQQVADLQAQKTAVDADLVAAQAQVTDLQQQVADLQAQYELTGATKAETAEKIVEHYYQTHYYEKDVYDCNNMADDVWDMLKAFDINARIAIGDVTQSITDILQSNHAWVLAEVAPGEFLALDPTAGIAVPDTPENYLYYRGWYFNDPAEVKANDDLRLEYNTRVGFRNLLAAEINNAVDLYNNSTTQAEADKWQALWYKLVELKDAQEALLTNLMSQINQLATQFSL